MPYTPAEQRSVQIGNALNVAATLAAGSAYGGQDPVTYFDAYVDHVVAKVLEIQAEHAVKDEFPGTTVAAQAPAAAPVQPYQPVQQYPSATYPQAPHPAGPGSTPAPIPQPQGQGGGELKDGSEALWRMFFENSNAFVDQRASKRNPAAADFVHGSLKNAKGYGMGLWINGKFPNAEWVNAELRNRGYVA